ncbi:NTP transferase domain-containing protein [Chloroflexota bacterium]
MNEILLSTRAYANLISLAPRERLLVNQALLWLRNKPPVGLRLWGQSDLYLYLTAFETKIVYKLCGRRIIVLAIKAIPEHGTPGRKKISAVVLAAGKAGRKGEPPVACMAESLLDAGIDDLVVVLGYHAEEARKELQSKDVKVIVNPDYEYGISRSLKSGLRIVAQDTQAVFLALGNRPFIKPEIVKQMIRAYKSQGATIIVPTFSHVRGHPIMFDNLLIPELLKARGNTGGRGVLRHHSREMKQFEVSDADMLESVN